MKSIAWTKYGGAQVLKVTETDCPQAKDHEILIKVMATTVTAGDCEIRSLAFPLAFRMMLRLAFGIFKPRGKVLGQELSGVVVAKGQKVKRFQVGDEIFGTTGFNFGAYREYTCMAESLGSGALCLKPQNMTFHQAAGAPLGGLEALHYLKNTQLQPGQRVLVNGAGGSIGTSVIQLAKMHGAEVVAVDRRDKLDFLSSLGADRVIDYAQEDFTRIETPFDVIFDVVGKSHFEKSLGLLTDEGVYIIANPNGRQKRKAKHHNKRHKTQVLYKTSDQSLEDLEQLKTLIEQGHIKTYIDKIYSLEDIVEAHVYVEGGHKKGNLIIEVAKEGV